jgi:hypothetical protein
MVSKKGRRGREVGMAWRKLGANQDANGGVGFIVAWKKRPGNPLAKKLPYTSRP